MKHTSIKTWLFYVGITCLLILNTWILNSSFKRAQQHEIWINNIAHSSFLLEQISTDLAKKEEYDKHYKVNKDRNLLNAIEAQKEKINEQLDQLIVINIDGLNRDDYNNFKRLINLKLSGENVTQFDIDQSIAHIKQTQQENIEANIFKTSIRQKIFFWFLIISSSLSWSLLTFSVYQLNLNSRRRRTEEIEQYQLTWLKNHLNEIDRLTSEDTTPNKTARIILDYISQFPFVIDAKFYIFQDNIIEEVGLKDSNNQFLAPSPGSLILEAKKKDTIWLVKNIPKDYWTVASGFGKGRPNSILFIPITLKQKKLALIEVASFDNYTKKNLDLFYGMKEIIGANFNIIQSRQEQRVLLKKTQILAKELKVQKDDLKIANNVLAKQASELEAHQESLNVRNIQLENISRELELKADALEKSNTYKSDFLTKVSHELRTPLNGVLLLSTLLIENKEKTLTPKQIQFAQSINSAGNDLLLLISDILDLSKIEANKLTIHEDRFSIVDFIDNIYKTFHQQVEVKGLNLVVQIEETLRSQIIKTDKMRLEQILRNFISNSIKFTNKGEITIYVKKTQDNNAISFGIKDTGIGIEDSKKEIIFKAFEQADGTICRQYGGTGLGLTISLELASLIGGKIDSSSQIGVGSKFEIILPLEMLEAKNEIIIANDGQQVNDSATNFFSFNKNILIVDDDVRNLFALTSVLERKGFIIDVAKDGTDALTALNTKPHIDLVLMDIMMPIMDGYETIEKIRTSTSHYKNIPIIALTAHATSEDKEKCLSAGANGFLAKPVITENLMKILSTQLATNENVNAIN